MQNLPSSLTTAPIFQTVVASNANAAERAQAAATGFADAYASETGAHGALHSAVMTGHIPSATNTPDNAPGDGYASFIEPGRDNYTGAPVGFATIGTKNGTLSVDEALILRQKLKDKNAHDNSLETLNQLIASGQPLTIASLQSGLTGTMRLSESLSDDERGTLRMLFAKCGLSTQEADALMTASDEGRNKEIWNTLAARTAEKNIPAIELSRKETLALLKGMDMSPSTSKAIMAQFGDKDNLSLSIDEMNTFFAAVRSELSDRSNASRVAAGLLPDAVRAMLDASKLNAKTDPVSDMRGSRDADRLERRMNESMQEKIATSNARTATRLEAEIEDDTQEKQELASRNSRKDSSADQFGTLSAKSGTTEKSAVSHLVTVTEAPIQETAPLPNTGQANLEHLAKAHRQEVFEQVRAGFLQTGQNGATSLTLQLDPKDLGQLTLIVSAHQGELRAVIRAENAETAAVLTEQLAALRQTLEDQGLKVAELEVRTGLEDHPGAQQWQSAEERNQLLDARERDRAQRLARIRSEAGSSHKEVITVQHSRQNTGNGLYIVA